MISAKRYPNLNENRAEVKKPKAGHYSKESRAKKLNKVLIKGDTKNKSSNRRREPKSKTGLGNRREENRHTDKD